MEYTLLIVSIYFATSVYGTLTDISVQTNVGTIDGLTDDAVQFQESNKSVSRFLGIPFAKPPVGKRRYRRPEVHETLQTPYNATFHRPHCPQIAYSGTAANEYIKYFKTDEDCLYLNIYVPGSDINVENKYPVMIWIHGGTFVIGGADIYSGDILSAFNDVIVVTFNYRLGLLGFLSDGSRNSGNFGLWDQKMVIQWVHDNIDSFGGDVSRVTLFGNSAGAASVLYQALHVGNKGKIHRIIAQSGSILASWAYDSEMIAKKKFVMFTESLKCAKSTYELTINCLQDKQTDDILSKENDQITFFPIVDMEFVKESPALLFANETNDSKEAMKQFGSLDFLSGVASMDGANFIINRGTHINMSMGVDINYGMSKQLFDSWFVDYELRHQWFEGYITTSPTLTKAVIHAYTDWYNPNDKIVVRDKMIELSSDLVFCVPAIKTARLHSDMTSSYMSSAKTYFYVFDHKPSLDPSPNWLKGTTHTLEIPYVFGMPDVTKVVFGLPLDYPINIPANELRLSLIVMKMWTNFAKTGNPNTESRQQPTWPVYSSNTQQYMTLSSNMTSHSVQQRFAATRVAFWTDLAPAIMNCSKQMTSQADNSDTSGVVIVTLVLLAFCFH